MSTAKVFKSAEGLATRELEQLVKKLEALVKKKQAPKKLAKPVVWDDLTAWRQRVFGTQVKPNPVLLARDEETW